MHEFKVICLSWLIAYVFCYRLQSNTSAQVDSIKSAHLRSDGVFTSIPSLSQSTLQHAVRHVWQSQQTPSMNDTSAGHSVFQVAQEFVNESARARETPVASLVTGRMEAPVVQRPCTTIVGLWIKTFQCTSSRWSTTKSLTKQLLQREFVHVKYMVCNCDSLTSDALTAKWLGLELSTYQEQRHRIQFVTQDWCDRVEANKWLGGFFNPSIAWNFTNYSNERGSQVPQGKVTKGLFHRSDQLEGPTAWSLVAEALEGLSVVFAEPLYTFNFLPPVARRMPKPCTEGYGIKVIFRQPGTLLDWRALLDTSLTPLDTLIKSGVMKPTTTDVSPTHSIKHGLWYMFGKSLKRLSRAFFVLVEKFSKGGRVPWTPGLHKKEYHSDPVYYYHDQPPALVPPLRRAEQLVMYGPSASSWSTNAGLQPKVRTGKVNELVSKIGKPGGCKKIVYLALGGEGFRTVEAPQNFPGQHAATVANLLRVLSSKHLQKYCFLFGTGGTLAPNSAPVKEMLTNLAQHVTRSQNQTHTDCSLMELHTELEEFVRVHAADGFEEWIPFQNKGKEGNCVANTLVGHRLPQPEILASGQIDAFLSHMGTNSMVESLAYQVPLLALPNALSDQGAALWACGKLGAAIDFQPVLRPDPYWPAFRQAKQYLRRLQASRKQNISDNSGGFDFSMEQLSGKFEGAVRDLGILLNGEKLALHKASVKFPKDKQKALSLTDLQNNIASKVFNAEDVESKFTVEETVDFALGRRD